MIPKDSDRLHIKEGANILLAWLIASYLFKNLFEFSSFFIIIGLIRRVNKNEKLALILVVDLFSNTEALESKEKLFCLI